MVRITLASVTRAQRVNAASVIELELRQPSMLHGKKGFERIVWAFKNVLNRSLTWLFHDVQSPGQPPSG